MPKDKIRFTMRLDPVNHAKIKIIANDERRSTTSMIEILIIREIKRYEKENGSIEVTDEDIYPK